MKAIELLLTGLMVVLLAVAVAAVAEASGVYRIDAVELADPVEVETGGGEAPRVLMAPTAFSHDTARIELLLPADAVEPEVEIGGGVAPRVLMAPAAFSHDTARIELLLPAD